MRSVDQKNIARGVILNGMIASDNVPADPELALLTALWLITIEVVEQDQSICDRMLERQNTTSGEVVMLEERMEKLGWKPPAEEDPT